MRRHRLSLRTTLLLGYALGIAGVLTAVGFVAQDLYWRSLIGDLDADLSAQANALGGSIGPETNGHYDLDVPTTMRAFFQEHADAYYVVMGKGGAIIDFTNPELRIPPIAPPAARTRGSLREVAVAGPQGTTIVMGRSLASALDRYDEFVRTLRLAGGTGLVLVLGTAWVFVRRVLAPIERIGRTAEAMSAENLGLRIDVGGTESELGQVARALNDAFDRLQNAFDRQARFTADASHELRTPLTTMLSESEWSLRRERTVEEYRGAFQVCLRAAERMRAVVEGLLTLARADAGRATLATARIDLAEVARDVLASSETAARSRGLALTADLQPAVILGDAERLRELVRNLVENALQYNRTDGFVRVSTSAVNGTVKLEVHDSGIGIGAEDLPHIFDRFYRADSSRSRAAGGSGLGLAIAKWIVEEHGGRIECTSDPATGTTFRSTFVAS